MLYGRERECDALDQLLDAARGGHSGVLVLRGDPGIGKTALLQYALRSATGFRVARAVGVECERELAYATLHQLCAPMLDVVDELPAIQRDAIEAAFGLRAAQPPERFLVGLATLSLLSAASDEKPLLCAVDDAQWLDRESAQALGFVARRLLADPVALVFATRQRDDDLSQLPELTLGSLEDADARALLKASMTGPVHEGARDWIVSEARGNPLALLELPRGLTSSQLAAGFSVSSDLSLSSRIEDSFRRRADELSLDARRLLLLAAADPVGEPAVVWDAAQRLQIASDAVAPAAAAGLLDIGRRVVFRHPLVRSAIYRSASPDQRRAVHRALADATDQHLDPDRRAWHLAEATLGADEDVAAELERSAGRAEQRGGLAASAAFLERSVELTVAPQRRAQRMLAAAGAHLAAGAWQRARVLLEHSTPELVDSLGRARALAMEGAIRFAAGRGGETPSLLVDAAHALKDDDRRMARETLVEALETALWAGHLTTGTTVLDVAEAARAMPALDGDRSTASLLLRGYTEQFTNGYEAAVGWWRHAVQQDLSEVGERPHRWQGMVWNAAGHMLDFDSHTAAAHKWLRQARQHGALSTLGQAFSAVAWSELLSGRPEAAEALIREAMDIGAATGAPSMPGAEGINRLALLTLCGREQEARHLADTVMEGAFARGQGLGVTLAQFFMTKLELSLGRYDEARIYALSVFEQDPLYTGTMALGDIVEATVRAGDTDAARAALARLSERAEASRAPWGLGLLARARALLAEDRDAEAFYLHSLDYLARSGVATELARSRLLYGEWLRRQRRRRDARIQLHGAHEALQAMGAEAWANRAGIELRATGARARERISQTRDELTAQERQVAQLAASGESNAEIAAQLFISPHTVAYHLRKVFGKLGVTSRQQLRRALPDSASLQQLA